MLLSDYLATVADLSHRMSYNQERADYYLKMFNCKDELYNAQCMYQHTEGIDTVDICSDETLTGYWKEFLQKCAEFHITQKRIVEAQLEDLVKLRYLENSH